MNIYSIYKATNKHNGKIYIGMDSNWPKRYIEHHNEIKRSKTKFHNAIRKYGRDGFDWCLIYQSHDYEHIKNIECFFIEEYDTFKHGYNMTLGGEGTKGIKLTNEHKQKLSLANKGKKLTEESKKKISEASKKQTNRDISGIGSYWKGRKRSKEDLEKKSQIFGKEWVVINPNGEKMNIKSLRKFCKENDLSAAHMGAVALGKRKHHKRWKCERKS
jgi:group I intron endonuclease